MATAVLDIGKSNVKLVVMDEHGRTLWTSRAPNKALPGPPYPHVDTEAIWAFALQSLRQAGSVAPIEAIVTTAHGATGALVHDDGLALPILDYEHPAPFDEDHGYAAVRPPFAEILSPNLEGGINWGRQIHWQSRRFPEAFARTRSILAYPQYWSWRLSGVAASETTSLGAHSDLWEPRGGRFSRLVERCGWSRLFPPVRPAHAVLGPITAEVAAATGLDPGCKVICGIHDSNASLTPHLLTRPSPFTVVSTGTWVIIMAIGATAELDEARDTLANVNVLGEPVPTARFMGGRDHEILVPPGSAPASDADIAAVIASGCLALPCFSAPCGPFPRSRGRIEGDVPALPGARSALAALFLALMTDQCLDMLGAAGDTIVEGGFAANRAYVTLLAALRPGGRVLASTDATGTSLGAAMLARWEGPHAAPAAAAVAPVAWPGLGAYRQAWLERLRET
ncbi:MAG: FGGY family carbohydrate kinase [Alsobacter sp.]